MDEKENSDWRDGLFNAADPSRLMNEFLLAVLLPAAFSFVALWMFVRLYLDSLLLSLGFSRMQGHPLPFIALESGLGRYLLLVVSGAFVVLGYVGIYIRYLRPLLKERGIV